MQKIREYITAQLQDFYSSAEINQISFLLIEKATGLNRTEQLINKSTIFSPEVRKELDSLLEKLKKNTPVQYVIGETEFFDLKFEVNESVLIPRPETEELIELIINSEKGKPIKNILDIGTGSGCIAVCLKKHFNSAEIDAIDISDESLLIANKNAEKNKVNINFLQADIFKWNLDKKWDIIVSNPPYIPEKEKANMELNVLAHEPAHALFVPNSTPLLFYERIATFALTHLNNSGRLYFEIHYDMADKVYTLLKNMGFTNIEVYQDMAKKDRIVKAVLSNIPQT